MLSLHLHTCFVVLLVLLLRLASGAAVSVKIEGHHVLQCYEPSPQLDPPDLSACHRALDTMRKRFSRLRSGDIDMGASQTDSGDSLHLPINFAWTRNGFCQIRIEVEQSLPRNSWVYTNPMDLLVFSNGLIRQCVSVGRGMGWGGTLDFSRKVGPPGGEPPLQAYVQISVSWGRQLSVGEKPYNESYMTLESNYNASLSTNATPPALGSPQDNVSSLRDIERRQPPPYSAPRFPNPI